MSFDATNWAIKQRGLKPAAKIVLWHLCDRYHPDHGCFPSQETLADDCELPRSTLNVHLTDLERAGLIRREQRRDRGSKRQESTRYRFPFEPGFEPLPPENPCPEAGHGSDNSVSSFEGEPSPENGESRVQNLDSNPVREPVIEPVTRESASERDDGEDRKAIFRAFKAWYPTWPTYLSDSEDAARKEWFALSAEERAACSERTPAFLAAVKAAKGKVTYASVYLKNRAWEKLEDPKSDIALPTQHTPFSKAWNALRLFELLKPMATAMPVMSAFQQMLVKQGGAAADDVIRERRERYGWPKVTGMHERASRALGGIVPAQLAKISEEFERVHVGSARADAWRRLHAARGWPWVPDMGAHSWLYFPAADGDSDADVAAALARFEGLIEEVRGNDHAA